MRYFFIEPDDLKRASVTISGKEARHMGTVLRIKPGMIVGLCDGRGYQGKARIRSLTRKQVVLEVLQRFPSRREPKGAIVVAQAMLKDQKMDLLVRQLTELGMTGWHPFISARSVPQPGKGRQASRADRWARIAREAVKQCRRGRVPDMAPLGQFADVLNNSHHFDTRILFWEGAGQALPVAPEEAPVGDRRILMVVGPEGGFSDGEAHAAQAAGFRLATLGPRILRAETATIAACTLVQHLYGDLSQAPPQDGVSARDDGASGPV
ncbi:MAG: RsmE family RNA methyltransferase [Desulfobacterales bacterium]|jgi:16S rRNA (uracil1498-N3)-methyltransferase